MMDVIVASKLAETRYAEMLDEAAIDRRAHSADSNTNRIGLIGRIENAVCQTLAQESASDHSHIKLSTTNLENRQGCRKASLFV